MNARPGRRLLGKAGTTIGPIVRRFLPILHGMLIMALALACLRWRYEQEVLQAIIRDTVNDRMSSSERVLALTSRVHDLMWERKVLFNKRGALKPNLEIDAVNLFLFDTLNELNTGYGACGGFTTVASRVLQEAGYQVRVAQMLCTQSAGACHVILEVLVDGKWVVLDPLFNLSFRSPNGTLASFKEVSRNWATFKAQVPLLTGELHYPIDLYDFHGVRYTNWDRFGVFAPVVRAIVGLFTNADEVSLRSFILPRNTVTVTLLAVVNLCWLVVLGARFRRRKREEVASSTPSAEPVDAYRSSGKTLIASRPPISGESEEALEGFEGLGASTRYQRIGVGRAARRP